MNVSSLADHIVEKAKGHQRFLVAIAGPPGAGKSTLAGQLQTTLIELKVRTQVVPMDGFHLDNAILSQRGWLARKGAPETFDSVGFVHLIKRLSNFESDVVFPIFDRTLDKSIAGAGIISDQDTVLIIEGNYLFLKEHPWSELQTYWQETILINPGIEVLEKRLIDRWIAHGLNYEDAKQKAMSNDLPNARYVLDNSMLCKIQID